MLMNSEPVAANDNVDLGTLAYCSVSVPSDCDDGAEAGVGSRKPLYVVFTDENAERLGFESRTVSVDYLLYLLDGHVAEEDQAAAELLEEMIEPYCH